MRRRVGDAKGFGFRSYDENSGLPPHFPVGNLGSAGREHFWTSQQWHPHRREAGEPAGFRQAGMADREATRFSKSIARAVGRGIGQTYDRGTCYILRGDTI